MNALTFRRVGLAVVVLSSYIAQMSFGQVQYTVTDLGTLGGIGSAAYCINDEGYVVGLAGTATGDAHAFLYRNGSMLDIGTLGGFYSGAFGINNNGQIVGDSTTAQSDSSYAFLYSDGSIQNLGTLGGASSISAALSINQWGQVVGRSGNADGDGHAFLYSNGMMYDLGTLGGD